MEAIKLFEGKFPTPHGSHFNESIHVKFILSRPHTLPNLASSIMLSFPSKPLGKA